MEYKIIAILIMILTISCSTFSGRRLQLEDHEGRVTIKVLRSHNQAFSEGAEVNVLTQSGQMKGSGQLLSGSIKGGTGDIRIIIEGSGNAGFKEY